MEIVRLKDNWDGYGAAPVNTEAMNIAKTILRRALTVHKCPEPFVAPGSDGGLGIEWESASRVELLIDVPPKGLPTYLLVIPGPFGEEEREGTISDALMLDGLLRQMQE